MITGQYYAYLLAWLHETIHKKNVELLTRGVLLRHDNVTVHKARVARSFAMQGDFKQFNFLTSEVEAAW